MMPDRPIDLNLLGEFEQGLNVRRPEKSRIPARVLGYGEISTVLEIQAASAEGLAFKRMPMFRDEHEAEAYGAVVGTPQGNEVPSVMGQLRRHAADLCQLAWPDAAKSGRFPLVMEAAARLKEQCPEAEVRIPLSGPFSIACALVGFQGILTEVLMSPDTVAAALRHLAAGQVEVCRTFASRGFRAMFFDSASCPPIITADSFTSLVLPALCEMMSGIRNLTNEAPPLILGGNSFPVLPTQAYLQITGLFDLKGGAVLSFVLLVPAMIVYLLQRYWVSRKSYVTITGKVGAQTMVKSVAPWARYPLLGLCLFMAGAILYFYVLLFYASLVMALGANHAWTLQHYRVIFTEGLKAIRDTLIIAGAGMPLGGLFGILVGYLVVKKEFPGRQAMEVVSMVNYSLPGTIVGIAYLMAFNDPPIVLTGTALVIVACYVFRYSPTGIRATVATLAQIDPSIEEASQSLGAGCGTTFRRITLPLILPAFFAGLGVVFIRSMTAISATIFLVSINWTLITVRILENITELSLGPAAAFSVLVVAIVFVVIALIGLALRRFRAAGAVGVTSILGG